MHVLVSLVVSVCGLNDGALIKRKMEELERANPGAKVTLKLDRKCLGLPKAVRK